MSETRPHTAADFVDLHDLSGLRVTRGEADLFARRVGDSSSGWVHLQSLKEGDVISGGMGDEEISFAVRADLSGEVEACEVADRLNASLRLVAAITVEHEQNSYRTMPTSEELLRDAGPFRLGDPGDGNAWRCGAGTQVVLENAESVELTEDTLVLGGTAVILREPKLPTCEPLLGGADMEKDVAAIDQVVYRITKALLIARNAEKQAMFDKKAHAEKVHVDRERTFLADSVMQRNGLTRSLTSDPLTNVIHEVMIAEHVQPNTDFEPSANLPFPLAVKRHAEASSCFDRPIVLEKNWYRRNHGSIVAQLKDSGTPVALVWRSGRYRALVGSDGSEQVVDEKFADQLLPQAFQFLPSLEGKKVAYRDLWGVAKVGVTKDIILVIGLGLVAAVVNLAVPYATGLVIDYTLPGRDYETLIYISIVLVAVAISSATLNLVSEFALVRFQGVASLRLTASLVSRVARLRPSFFGTYTAGDLMQRLTGIEYIRKTLAESASSALVTGLFSLVYLVSIASYSFTLLLVVLLLMVFLVGLYALLAKASVRYYDVLFDATGQTDGINIAALEAIETIRVNAAETRFVDQYLRPFARTQRAQYGINFLTNIYTTFEVGMLLISSAAFYVVYEIFLAGTMSSGDFLGFTSAYSLLLSGMILFGRSFLPLVSLGPVLKRLKPILEAPTENEPGQVQLDRIDYGVVLRGVSYSPGPNAPLILDNLDLDIPKGKVTALVGPSGSGKSVLVKLLTLFLQADSGVIRFGPHPIRSIQPQSLRRNLGLVLQGQQIEPGSIRSRLSITGMIEDEEAWDLLEQAALADDVRDMPMGLDSVVGPATMSGGQQQRLCIAAALSGDPSLIILDDATSALDNIAQATVFDSIEKSGRTVLVVSQRLSTVKHADEINFLDDGRIAERGTYEELMAQNGRFAEFARRQEVVDTASTL